MREFVLLIALAGAAPAADGFVLVRGGTLRPGVRLDDFEMADHPVTNAEYRAFVEAARRAAPQYWVKGLPPAGMENHPVIFVSRYDALAYAEWRTRREGRVYRLPAVAEFEYAARGGNREAIYPWGNAGPEGRANYDPSGTRGFAEWRKFLKPVQSYAANAFGLYDMAGNVWQLVDKQRDPATARFRYRIAAPADIENGIAGGSWARSAAYLRCDANAGASPGIRHPDIGFRLVREPAGQTHFRREPRRLAAANAGAGAVYLGWQLLARDGAQTGFHVYRARGRDGAGERLTGEPLLGGTNFVDPTPGAGRVYYRVRPVGPDGREGPPSEWAAVETGAKRSNLIAVFEPAVRQGGMTPVFGDLDGDGVLDAVIRLDNGIHEMSHDPGVPVELEAFTSYGRSLWRRPLVYHDRCFGNANNVPVVVFDMDGDGKSEALTQVQEGGKLYLAALDGMTGRVRRKTPWTAMATDFARSSTRVHMSVAYLNGKTPAIVTQTGLYENEILDAYDANLNKLWQYRSFGETSGSGSHHVDIADVDGDGRDEVFDGATLLNPDGSVRWSIHRGHPDIVAVKRILPGAHNLQVFYAVESSLHAGGYVVDAPSGKIVWKVNRDDDPRWIHAHAGWAADIFEGSPGMELLTNRDGHDSKDMVLFSADGKILLNPFPTGWYPVNWTGGRVRELMNESGDRIGRFNGKTVELLAGARANDVGKAYCPMVADLAGDYRDEVVCIGDGKVMVFSNVDPIGRRAVTRTADRQYRLWMARNMGGGYPSYFD